MQAERSRMNATSQPRHGQHPAITRPHENAKGAAQGQHQKNPPTPHNDTRFVAA